MTNGNNKTFELPDAVKSAYCDGLPVEIIEERTGVSSERIRIYYQMHRASLESTSK